MAITTTMTNSYKQDILSGTQASGDTYKIALYTSLATLDASTTAYSATNEVVGTGYTAGGATVTFGTAPSSTSTTAFVTPSASIVYSNVTLSTAFDAVLIYNSTQSNKAVSVHTFGSQTVTAGTFTLTMPVNDASTGLIRLA